MGIDRDDRTFEVGDDVRVKLNKSKLSKGSDDKLEQDTLQDL